MLQFDFSSKHVRIYHNSYRKKLSAIIYRLQKLRFIHYWNRPGFFEIIDYRFRFSSERFIVPITVHQLAYRQLHYRNLADSLHNESQNFTQTP